MPRHCKNKQLVTITHLEIVDDLHEPAHICVLIMCICLAWTEWIFKCAVIIN